MADVLPPVTGDPAARSIQMFLNVLLNAAQAVTAGGTVFAEVTQQGDGVAVRISDTGSGIPEEARSGRSGCRGDVEDLLAFLRSLTSFGLLR